MDLSMCGNRRLEKCGKGRVFWRPPCVTAARDRFRVGGPRPRARRFALHAVSLCADAPWPLPILPISPCSLPVRDLAARHPRRGASPDTEPVTCNPVPCTIMRWIQPLPREACHEAPKALPKQLPVEGRSRPWSHPRRGGGALSAPLIRGRASRGRASCSVHVPPSLAESRPSNACAWGRRTT